MADPDQTSLTLAGETGNLLRFRDDELHDEPAVTLEAFLDGQTNANAVRLEAGDDAARCCRIWSGWRWSR